MMTRAHNSAHAARSTDKKPKSLGTSIPTGHAPGRGSNTTKRSSISAHAARLARVKPLNRPAMLAPRVGRSASVPVSSAAHIVARYLVRLFVCCGSATSAGVFGTLVEGQDINWLMRRRKGGMGATGGSGGSVFS